MPICKKCGGNLIQSNKELIFVCDTCKTKFKARPKTKTEQNSAQNIYTNQIQNCAKTVDRIPIKEACKILENKNKPGGIWKIIPSIWNPYAYILKRSAKETIIACDTIDNKLYFYCDAVELFEEETSSLWSRKIKKYMIWRTITYLLAMFCMPVLIYLTIPIYTRFIICLFLFVALLQCSKLRAGIKNSIDKIAQAYFNNPFMDYISHTKTDISIDISGKHKPSYSECIDVWLINNNFRKRDIQNIFNDSLYKWDTYCTSYLENNDIWKQRNTKKVS